VTVEEDLVRRILALEAHGVHRTHPRAPPDHEPRVEPLDVGPFRKEVQLVL
jgi:hypothetical protein